MDSINNAASAAGRAIFGGNQNAQEGESGREPVSGVTGSGTTNEPYDTGNTTDNPSLGGTAGSNADPSTYDTTENPSSYNSGPHETNAGNKLDPRVDSDRDGSYTTNTSSTTGGSSQRLAGEGDTSTGPGVSQGTNVTGDIRPEHDTDKTGVTGIHSNDAKFSSPNPSSSNEGAGTVQPSVGADPSSGQSQQQKQQGADRPGEEPSAESTGAIKDKKNAAEESGDKSTDDTNDSGQAAGGHKPSLGQPGGGPHDEEKKKNLGTGEKYVKSSGMAADGGDFDATNPGAGREADRLLDAKGIQRSEGPGPVTDEGAKPDSSPTGSGDKPGVGDKIKGKLHLGGH
ncbi:MAG: hypothetical protein M1837_003322 [Sclerophora amabilis]|nr:MAG: hypothetical protein M1837_003322 [Sclerophora amabilis]